MGDAGRLLATNRKARHDYHILETVEAGIVLKGTEIKSVRNGKVNLKESFARIENEEVILYHMHISPYDYGNRENHDPLRPRKLMLHKQEIRRFIGKTQEKGLTLIPLSIYIKNGHAKIDLALAKGKRLYDKREDLKRKQVDREIERAFREGTK